VQFELDELDVLEQAVSALPTLVAGVARPFIIIQPTAIAPMTSAPASATQSTVTIPLSAKVK